ncbi:MAG: hypothetical protein PHD88_02125 [Firmicutes bacterium]|nr:hypothetical protein [Bacillota bacterium]MDD4693189.1 hypothetical protein [Bacillota bacterium]
MRNCLRAVLCVFIVSFSASAISQHWLDELGDYEQVTEENISLNFHKDSEEVYEKIAIELDKELYLSNIGSRSFKNRYNTQTLVELILELLNRIATKLPLSIPETGIYLYPNSSELFRVTSYNDSFYVVMGNEVHLTGDSLYKITEYVLACNYPNMDRKLLEALAKYFTPCYDGVHQKAQYWLNFQELPPLRTFSVKSFAAMTEKDWDAYVSFLGFVLEEKVKPGFLWNNVTDLDRIASLLKMNLATLESEWFNHIKNTFYLKMARREEVKAGEEIVGVVLLENDHQAILNPQLRVYSSIPGRPGFNLVASQNYYQINTDESYVIRFSVKTPKTAEQLSDEAWLNRSWNLFYQQSEEGMNLQKPSNELLKEKVESYPEQMLLSAVLTYSDSYGKNHSALMSYPVKIIE